MQPLLGLPLTDPAIQAIAASAGALHGGGLEAGEGEGGIAGLRVGGGGNVLTAQNVTSLMLGNMRSLGEHKVSHRIFFFFFWLLLCGIIYLHLIFMTDNCFSTSIYVYQIVVFLILVLSMYFCCFWLSSFLTRNTPSVSFQILCGLFSSVHASTYYL